MNALKESEARIMERVSDQMQTIVQEKVQGMVSSQLTAAGFHPDLSAGDLSLRKSIMERSKLSYAGAAGNASQMEASLPVRRVSTSPNKSQTATDRKEEQFWVARRSLRLWPIVGGSKEGLRDCLLYTSPSPRDGQKSRMPSSA